MNYEQINQKNVSYFHGEGALQEKGELGLSDTDTLPITDILRFMTHEKFILSVMVILGIGKILILVQLFQLM